jgi:membrane carboxypeptidase/penicillin-binding protein
MLVVGEDKRFWDHRGVDIAAIVRACYYVFVRGQLQGGSTIEQQLARILTGDRKFSIQRKLREILLASVVGDFIDKRSVAVLYLCCAYYGWRMNSLSEAAVRIGFSPRTVGIRVSAEMVARLKYPEPHDSSAHWRSLMEKRADYIVRKCGLNAV